MPPEKKKPSEIHAGHRKRLREKFKKDGFDALEIHEALELFLFYAIPRKDTNLLAHQLLEHFGSLSGVLDASYEALADFGLTENVATLLKALPGMSRLYVDNKKEFRSHFVYPEYFCSFFRDKYIGRKEETVYLLLLDSKYRQLFCEVISKGSITSTDVPIRKIAEYAIHYEARYAVISHNHPYSDALPSNEDLDTTKSIYSVLKLVSVSLLDHIIVSATEELSLANSTFGRDIFIE